MEKGITWVGSDGKEVNVPIIVEEDRIILFEEGTYVE